MGLSSLDKIRAQYQAKTPICPKCGKPVTIEKTKYAVTEICEHCLEHAKVDMLDCCDLPDYQKVRATISGGGQQVREQCMNCGNVKANAIGGLTKEQRDALPELNQQLREAGDSFNTAIHRDFFAKVNEKRQARRDAARDEWMQQYTTVYLKSDEWHEKRMAVLRRDNHLCQCCLKSFATQVHHKSYEFVDLKGSEPAFDLVAICTPCHNRIENMKKEKRM